MTEQHTPQPHDQNHVHGGKPTKLLNHVGFALVLILIFYGILLCMGYPQKWEKMSNDEGDGGFRVEKKYVDTTVYDVEDEFQGRVEVEDEGEAVQPGGEPDAKKADKKNRPPSYMVIPFAVLLLCIAFFPLFPATARWWENNANKFWVGSSLGILALLYYVFLCDFTVAQYWPGKTYVNPEEHGHFAVAKAVFINAIIYEFLPFIVLLFALFVITGGIRVATSLKATPFVNVAILATGGVLASFIGTTGAAVLLIRPLLDMNRERKYKVHTVVFFIFIVCNCGGCLTPLGDPPLFLGYLRGVAFEWPLLALWPMWLFMNSSLLTLYYLWDSWWYYPGESKEYREEEDDDDNEDVDAPMPKMFIVSGWQLNVPLLFGVIAAIAFLDPGRPVPGTDWHPWFYLREAVQLGLAAISLFFSSALIRKENVFNFLAIGEVAALFFGIFLCMQAPLQILKEEGRDMVAFAEENTPDFLCTEKIFFWSTASLSTVLDNAPTYVVFFEAGKTVTPETEEERRQWRNKTGRVFEGVPVRGGYIDHRLLIAVALGTIFTGSITYIANAPNFLVKAIAEQDGVAMPSFFGFMAYSCLIVIPLMFAVTLIFIK